MSTVEQITEQLENLGLTDIIRLQTELSTVLNRRFRKDQALTFTDVVGSTAYFQRFGDEKGRQLLQRNHDILRRVLPDYGGRVVDTAGDGVFSCWQDAGRAAEGLIEIENQMATENADMAVEHHLRIRAGLHWGPVLTDGDVVSGDSVNLCARVANLAGGGQIKITEAAFRELPLQLKMRCTPLPQEGGTLKGIAQQVNILMLEWRDLAKFPDTIRIQETGEEIPIPLLDVIRFGRLAEKDGVAANDVVLGLPDEHVTKQISRWHFELRRLPDGFRFRTVSRAKTVVDGKDTEPGTDVPIQTGSVVQLGNVITLQFSASAAQAEGDFDMTIG